jgi:hypothetical protein
MSVKRISPFERLIHSLTGWKSFKQPVGEFVDCYKDRSKVEDVLINSNSKVNWGTNLTQTIKSDPGRVNFEGVGSGTPMQLGGDKTRIVTWGSGYGRYNQWKSTLPLPLHGSRYWITSYPTPQYDKRCIIMGPDKVVHELIQFDQDLGVLPAGFPQQALNRGSWLNGKLIDGIPVTASNMPGSAYIWGVNSSKNPHVQAFTTQDYIGGDGSKEFAQNFKDVLNPPVCGAWYYLDPESESYLSMVNKGGECEARAKALVDYGLRHIDRGNSTAILTQAGTWAANTNIKEFTINLNDLRLVY